MDEKKRIRFNLQLLSDGEIPIMEVNMAAVISVRWHGSRLPGPLVDRLLNLQDFHCSRKVWRKRRHMPPVVAAPPKQ